MVFFSPSLSFFSWAFFFLAPPLFFWSRHPWTQFCFCELVPTPPTYLPSSTQPIYLPPSLPFVLTSTGALLAIAITRGATKLRSNARREGKLLPFPLFFEMFLIEEEDNNTIVVVIFFLLRRGRWWHRLPSSSFFSVVLQERGKKQWVMCCMHCLSSFFFFFFLQRGQRWHCVLSLFSSGEVLQECEEIVCYHRLLLVWFCKSAGRNDE